MRRIPEQVAGLPVDAEAAAAARSPITGGRRGAGSGSPAVERFLGPVDVLHYTDWMFPPQRSAACARR